MKLSRLVFYRVRIGLKKTIRHASHSRRETDNIVVACRLADGPTGWGEGVPRPYVTGDTAEACMRRARSTDWRGLASCLEGDLAEGVRELDAFLTSALPPPESAGTGRATPLRCAVELAVLDALCRAAGLPLSAIARYVPEAVAVRHARSRVRYSAVITGSTPRSAYWRALLIRCYGFGDCKLKVGMFDESGDDAVLAAVRSGLGPRVALRVDANEAWDLEAAQRRCEQLARYDVQYVEQPLPADRWEELALLQRSQPLPIILDESVCTLEEARRAIEQGAGSVFNIRLSKCGGPIAAYRIAALAHQAGWDCLLGCQVGESAILSAAGRAFAASVGNLLFCEGSYDRHLLKCHFARRPPSFGRGGWADVLPGPGLGIEVCRRRVEKAAVDSFTVEFGRAGA